METLRKLREFDTLTVHNPLDEPFTVTWNKEPYTIGPRETLPFVQHIARHIAKHLAQHILNAKGRAFVDQLRDGKPRGHVVQKSVVGELAHQLLDAQEALDADELIDEFRKKGGIKQLPEEEGSKEAVALAAAKAELERAREDNEKLEARMARMEALLMEKGAAAEETTERGSTSASEEETKPAPKKKATPKKTAAPKKKEEPEEEGQGGDDEDPLDEM